MTLSKQLGMGLFCVVLLMFIGSLWTNTSNTRNFISQQLSSHAQDTATSLGLSVAPYIGDPDDLEIIKTMSNAIFDRGYYASIILTDLDGNIIISHTNPSGPKSVPNWFVTLFDITAPTATTEINDGWSIKGKLSVQSNTGFAHQQLWANTKSNFYLTLLVFGVALLFVCLLVKRVISEPINAVITQSEAISLQNFTQIKDVPKTVELKKFVNAINYMSTKLARLFQQLSEQSEKYRVFAYTDPLTSVGNRRAFQLFIEKLLRNEAELTSGHLLIVRASSLSQVHNEHGGDIGDKYLLDVCTISQKVAREMFDQSTIYRLGGADFAIVLEHTESDKIIDLAKTLASSFKRAEKSEYKSGTAHIGISAFDCNDDIAYLMESADNALSVAQNNNKGWEMSQNLSVTHSNEVWRDKIQSILRVGTSDFAAQAIVSKHQQIEYSEWFARVPNEQESASLPMSQLIPASIRLDQAQNLDKLIVLNLLERLKTSSTNVGLNLSRLSVFDGEFMDWFVTKLSEAGSNCEKLVIEISERALVLDIESLLVQSKKLKSMGIKIAVEHFGAQLAGIQHLRKLQPDYLKIDGRFTKNIQTELDNQLFVHSLVGIAHGLNIKVIAEMVETEGEKDWLLGANVDYLQGYFIAPPKPIINKKF